MFLRELKSRAGSALSKQSLEACLCGLAFIPGLLDVNVIFWRNLCHEGVVCLGIVKSSFAVQCLTVSLSAIP